MRSRGAWNGHRPREDVFPSPRNIDALSRLVRERRIDVTHGYEWGPGLELFAATGLTGPMPTVTTVMSMSVPHELPRHTDLVVGTADLARGQVGLRDRVHVMEPPIDTRLNRPAGGRAARLRLGLGPDDLVVSVVCRLTPNLDKLAGVLTAMDVVADLTRSCEVRMVVAGEGPGLDEVRSRASDINTATGTETIIVTGALADPSAAYDAADVVLGMGSSALKGMAFSKPLVVQGEAGYWRLLDEESLPTFLQVGWFGHGGRGPLDLEPILGSLVDDEPRRTALGELGRQVVVSRYGLDAATDQLLAIYDDAIALRPSRPVLLREAVRTSYELAKFKVARFEQTAVRPRVDRLRGVPVPAAT